MFYWPYLSTPDPTVKRKTGLLMPKARLLELGTASASPMPYFWALAPNYDFTLTPTLTSKQGLLLQAEWRHRLINGSYSIRRPASSRPTPAPSRTASPRYRATRIPGDRLFRGSIDTTGQFALNNNWVWGWDGSLVTDKHGDPGLRAAHLLSRRWTRSSPAASRR